MWEERGRGDAQAGALRWEAGGGQQVMGSRNPVLLRLRCPLGGQVGRVWGQQHGNRSQWCPGRVGGQMDAQGEGDHSMGRGNRAHLPELSENG